MSDNSETKPCPVCGKRMIRRHKDELLTSMPPQRAWFWYCGCGHREPGGIEGLPVRSEAEWLEEWERANGVPPRRDGTR